MSTRWSESDLKGRTGIKAVSGVMVALHSTDGRQSTEKKPSKYGNERTEVDGKKFQSLLEAKRYRELLLLWAAKEIRYFLRQVPFELDGGTKYYADYLVVWTNQRADGFITVEDCKGVDTDVYKIKRREVEHKYGIKITEIRA